MHESGVSFSAETLPAEDGQLLVSGASGVAEYQEARREVEKEEREHRNNKPMTGEEIIERWKRERSAD